MFPTSDAPFKTRIEVNRWHGYDELVADMERLQRAFPKFLTLSSIGKSVEGRDIKVMTILNPDTGAEATKAGMYIEANVHGNEIQGAEVCLYTIWYLMEHYDRLPRIKQLVDERVFYIVPTVNPDGREHFLQVHSGGRSGHQPVDTDNDGVADEDDVDDLNGNGVIEQMRRYVPGQGTHRISGLDPRLLELAPPGTRGDYVILGFEGLDNDGDGLVNEDGPGGYDPNRNWPADWQPNYVQNGSMDYPFQLPEARAVARFLLSKPNVAGVQSYHNSGGMILRGPGAESQGEYPPPDARVYDELGRNGERMLPYYRYLVIWSGLYTVHGGFIDWTNDDLGILSFSNELWNSGQYFNSPALKDQQRQPDSPITPRASGLFFDDKVELGSEFVDWASFAHPTLRDRRDRRLASHLRPAAAALHERGAVPPQHGLLALSGWRDAAGAARRAVGRRARGRSVAGAGAGRQRPADADHPGQGAAQQRRAPGSAAPRRRRIDDRRGGLGAGPLPHRRHRPDRAAGSVPDPRAQRPARSHDARDRVPRARRTLADADLRQRQGRQAVDRDPPARDAAAGAGAAAGALSGTLQERAAAEVPAGAPSAS